MNASHTIGRLADLRTRAKLSLGFGALVLLTLLLGGLAAAQLRASHHVNEAINDNWLPTVRWTLQLRALLNEFRTVEYEHIGAADADERKPRETRLAALATDIADVKRRATALPSAAEQPEAWKRLDATWVDYLAEHAKVRSLAQADSADTARALIRGKSEKLFHATMAELDAVAAFGARQSEAASESSRGGYVRALQVIAAAMVAAVAVGSALAWSFGRGIAVPLGEAVRVATRVAHGDLRVDLATRRRDEIGDLYAALRTMAQGLSGVVTGVRLGVDAIASASSEIAVGTQNLSDRTERQASGLQQTTSTLSRLTQTAAANADTAHSARKLAAEAREAAAGSGQIVDQVVERMGDIAQSSKRIGDITAVIDGLAFQTNILALNAAVEAARAGDHGRGFAVVASEVRTLAQRSAAASKEIRGLITASVEKVEAGSVLADDAGRTMRDVMQRVERLNALIGELSASSGDQRDGIADINRELTALDDTTQQNASMVEQSAAASASLHEHANRLTEAVAVFQT